MNKPESEDEEAVECGRVEKLLTATISALGHRIYHSFRCS